MTHQIIISYKFNSDEELSLYQSTNQKLEFVESSKGDLLCFKYHLTSSNTDGYQIGVMQQKIQEIKNKSTLYSINIVFTLSLTSLEDQKVVKARYTIIQERFEKVLDIMEPDLNDLKVLTLRHEDLNVQPIEFLFSYLQKAKNLESVEFKSLQDLSQKQEEQFKSLVANHLKNIRYLEMNVKLINQNPLLKFSADSLPHLHNLVIKDIKGTDQLFPLCAYSSVANLELIFCSMSQKQICQTLLNTLKLTNSSLKSLKLSFITFYDFNKDRFQTFIENYPELQSLDLTHQHNLQRKDLNLLKLNKLKKLNLACFNPLDYITQFEEINLETLVLQELPYYTSGNKQQPTKSIHTFKIENFKYIFSSQSHSSSIKKIKNDLQTLWSLVQNLSQIEIDISEMNKWSLSKDSKDIYSKIFEFFQKLNEEMKINLITGDRYSHDYYIIADNFSLLLNRRNFTINSISYYDLTKQIFQETNYLEKFKSIPENQHSFIYGMAALEENYRTKYIRVSQEYLYKMPSSVKFFNFKKIIVEGPEPDYFNRLVKTDNNTYALIQSVPDDIEYLELSCKLVTYYEIWFLIKMYKQLQYISIKCQFGYSSVTFTFNEKNMMLEQLISERAIQIGLEVQIHFLKDIQILLEKLQKIKNHMHVFYINLQLRLPQKLNLDQQVSLLTFLLENDNFHIFCEDNTIEYIFDNFSKNILSDKMRYLALKNNISDHLFNNHLHVFYDLYTQY